MDPSEFNKNHADQLEVLHEAFDKYLERNAKYHDVWKQYGALSQLVRSANKIDRLMEVWWHRDPYPRLQNGEIEEMLDDAIDAINHLVFFVRLARAGRLTGNAPQRPQKERDHDFMAVSDGVYGLFARCRYCGVNAIPQISTEPDSTTVRSFWSERAAKANTPITSPGTDGSYAAEQVKHFNGGQ